jgi:hypothetical protein
MTPDRQWREAGPCGLNVPDTGLRAEQTFVELADIRHRRAAQDLAAAPRPDDGRPFRLVDPVGVRVNPDDGG